MGKSLGQLMGSLPPVTKGTTYSEKPIGNFENVLIKIPKSSERLYLVEANAFTPLGQTEKIQVEEHYTNLSCPLGSGGWIQCNYYGFSPEDLGKRRIANIVAWKKQNSIRGDILLLDIRKAPEDAKAEKVMKTQNRRPWDLAIPCGGGIQFIPISPTRKE